MERNRENEVQEKVEQKIVVNKYGDGVAWCRGRMLGKGSYGSVYLAALKKPRSKYCCLPSVMAVKSAEISISGSIQKEKEVLSNLKGCANIIRCFGEETTIGENGTMAYNLLLEYASGGTLSDRIENSGGRGLPEFEARRYTKSLLLGLKFIHGIGYVHCDMKTDNILLVANGEGAITQFRAKIADFGLAKKAQQTKKRKLEAYWRGTPRYVAPESVVDNVQERPSDIWALGCVVLKMLTGEPPWGSNQELTPDDIFRKIGNEVPEIPSELSKEAKDFLKRCFVRNPSYRLTAEMLLSHSFVEGIAEDDDRVEEPQKIEDINEIESVMLVTESDEDPSIVSYYSSEEDPSIVSYYYSSEEDPEEIEDEFLCQFKGEQNLERQKRLSTIVDAA